MLARSNVRSRRKEAWRGWSGRRFDPSATLAVHCDNDFDAQFEPYQSNSFEWIQCCPSPDIGNPALKTQSGSATSCHSTKRDRLIGGGRGLPRANHIRFGARRVNQLNKVGPNGRFEPPRIPECCRIITAKPVNIGLLWIVLNFQATGPLAPASGSFFGPAPARYESTNHIANGRRQPARLQFAGSRSGSIYPWLLYSGHRG
jgi:hypothetical protein